MNIPSNATLEKIYGESTVSGARYASLAENFEKEFHSTEMDFFTAPGRTEIVGNHTDHNGGKVIAASITLDTIGAAAATDNNVINVISEGYCPITIELDKIDSIPKEAGTISLIAGMVEAMKKFGYQVGGFNLYASTTVIGAAGISSSASFEMLICSVLNYFYNDGKIPYSDYARIGQYSENNWWNKASGLMDQMACAVGGAIELDFAGEIKYEQISFDLAKNGYSMVITNTGGSHADLSEDYSAIPREMREVAAVFGKERLCEITMEELLDRLPEVIEKVGNDRAVLRAFHFLEENERVEAMADAIRGDKIDDILALLTASGNSSYKFLQNCYPLTDWKVQKIGLGLVLTEHFLKEVGAGCCRVHGGGFAGVIQTMVRTSDLDAYVEYMSKYFGKDNVYPMNVRNTGAVHVE